MKAVRKVKPSSDLLVQDLHARYHDEPGNLFGRDDCEWEGCQFWDAASFVLAALTPEDVPQIAAQVLRAAADDLVAKYGVTNRAAGDLRQSADRLPRGVEAVSGMCEQERESA